MTAATVCAICGAIHPVHDLHACTYENPHQEGTTMPTTSHRRPPPGGSGQAPVWTQSTGPERVRLECLRLATETGMPEHLIASRAAEWADFVLGTTKKEN
jgi:hypothetical protein